MCRTVRPQKLSFFSVNSHCIHDNVFTANYNKSGNRSKKCFLSSFQVRKERSGQQFFTGKQFFLAFMSNLSPNSGSTELSLLQSPLHSGVKIRCVEIVLITAAAEGSCCFILIFGKTDETELYGTNNKCWLDVNGYKQQLCLNFSEFAHFLPKLFEHWVL